LFATANYLFAGWLLSTFLTGLVDTWVLALATQSLADHLLGSLDGQKKVFCSFLWVFVFFCFFFVFFLVFSTPPPSS
jgi:hypothetical protein